MALMTQFHIMYAQEPMVENAEKTVWTKGGSFTFLLNQSAFENWVAGGVSSVSGTVGVNYDINYQKGVWSWDNKIIASFGITKIKDLDANKTDDR